MKNKGILLVLCTAIISGVAIFVNSFGVKESNPFVFTFLKNAAVAIFLFTVIFLVKEWKSLKILKTKDWWLLFLIGLVGGSVPFLLFFKGLSLTNVANGSFLHKTMFIYVAIFALIFLKEKLHKGLFFAAILFLAGNILLLKLNKLSFGQGELMILGATVLWAIENTISKKVLSWISPRVVAFGRMFFGSFLILVFLIATNQIQQVMSLNTKALLWILISIGFLFAYQLTWYTGLRDTKVTVATCILLLGAPITILLSFIFGKGALDIRQAFGMFLIVLGIVLAIGFRKIIFSMKKIRSLVLSKKNV